MSLLPINGDSENIWGTELLNFFSVFANPNGTLKSPVGTQVVYVSTGASASDANDGFSPYLPKATVESAVTALGGNPGVVQCLYGTIVMTGVTLAASQTIRGLGKGATILKINVDAGTGHYGINLSASQQATPCAVEDLQLYGPGNGAFTIGTPPANMTGIKTGSKARLVNLYVQGFYAGVEIASDHEYFENCKVSNNFYNVYETGVLLAVGNQTFVACDLTGATRASIAVADDGILDTVTFIQSHAGFAPLGIYKEQYVSGRPTCINSSWLDLQFEACGNACILEQNPSGTTTTIQGTTFVAPVFAAQGSGGQYYDSSLSSAAAVNVTVSHFRIIGDRTSTPGGATTVFSNWVSAGSQSQMTTDRLPLSNDFAGNWTGSVFDAYGSQNGLGSKAVVCTLVPGKSVTQGQVVQIQGQAASVEVFAGDNSHSYVGVAAYSAGPGGMVAVYFQGVCQVLCSEHITSSNCRLEIDPATPSQVRAVNMDTGASFAASTQVPSVYPVIGISNAGNSGTNTLIPIWLWGSPYIDPGYVAPGPVTSLPSASASNKGQLLTLLGNYSTTGDVMYACVETAAAAFEWVQVVNSTALALGNGSSTNLTALAKSTGTGPSSMTVVGWETVVIGANTYYRPLFQ